MEDKHFPNEVCGSSSNIERGEKCPLCHAIGKKVKRVTVENLVKEEYLPSVTEDHYYLCLSNDCHVVYFNEKGGTNFSKKKMKVPVWFKEVEFPRPICYCKDVSDTTILKHVVELGHRTLEEIQKHTGANTGKECLIKNPAGS